MRYKRGHSRTEFFVVSGCPPPPPPLSHSPDWCGGEGGGRRRPLIPPISPSSLCPWGSEKEARLRELPLMPPPPQPPPEPTAPFFHIPSPDGVGRREKEGGIIYLPLREKEALASFLVSSPLLLAAARSSVKGEINCVSLLLLLPLLLLLRYHKKSFPLPTSAFFLSNHHHGLAGKISGFGFGRLPF